MLSLEFTHAYMNAVITKHVYLDLFKSELYAVVYLDEPLEPTYFAYGCWPGIAADLGMSPKTKVDRSSFYAFN